MNPQHAKIADFVRRYMLKKAMAGDPRHGQRRATARYWHTLSVYRNIEQILDGEGADATAREICTIAALFHDIDIYSVEHAYHGDRGAETASAYLFREGYDAALIEDVEGAIREHNYEFDDDIPAGEQVFQMVNTLPRTSLYLIDADLLDKIGVSNILAAVMPMGLQDKHAYEAAHMLSSWPYERAQFWHALLSTPTGQMLGAQRLAFFEQFLAQVGLEIATEDPFAAPVPAAISRH